MLGMMSISEAQIAGGTYSIGSGGDYETLADVITALNANGISGNVTMEFMDGHVEDNYNVIGPYTGNFDYELILRPQAGATSVELTRIGGGKILDFISARNVILDGRAGGVGSPVLTVNNNSTSGAIAGISFEGQTRDVTVKYCNIVYRGVGMRTIGGGINDPEDIVVENCIFSTPEINEIVTSLWAFGHNCLTTSSLTLRNNVFESPNVGTGTIDTYTAIFFRSGIDVYNNIISVEGDIRAENIYGIRSFSGRFPTKNIQHNTIAFIGGSTTNSAVEVFPIYFSHQGTANFSNNILYNGYDCGPGCTRGVIKEETALGGIFNATDNIWGMLFSTVAQDRFYLIDLAPGDINTSYPGNTAAAQQNFNFVDFANNDLSITESSLLNERRFRTLNPTQTTDIYGNPRDPNLATKGAIESPFSSADNNLYNVSAPEFSGVNIVKFTTFGRFTVQVENPTPNLTFSPVFTVAPGATVSPESGQPFDFSETIQFTRSFDVTAANGTDEFSWTANIEGENRWPAGTYSVGSGLDFESVREAANSFAIFGIDGDVILELEDGYSGAWGSFFSGPGLDDYTITIRPEAGATDITAPFSSTGGKNVILDGRPGGVGESVLSFWALSYAASGTQGAVRHVGFSNQIGNGVVYGLRVFGNSADVVIENCSFTRPAALGSPTGGKFSVMLIQTGNNLTIRNNKIYDFKYTPTSSSAEFNGIEIVGDIAGKTAIYNNAISLKPERFAPIIGILIEDATTGEVDIFHNTINIEDSGTGDQAGLYAGILVLANPSTLNIQNNIVSNTSPGLRRGILYSVVSGERNIDYNNVSGPLPLIYAPQTLSAEAFKSTFINSSTVDVTFTDSSTGDLSLSSSLNNNSQIRTVLDAGVLNDINGTARGSFPMKGAYDAPGSGFNDILSLSFTGSSGLVIDSDNATVSVDADPGLDRSNLPVSITIPPGASISPDPSVGQDYTNPIVFTVTSANDMDKLWTITMGEAQVAPTDISLSSNIVNENNALNTSIGTLSTEDGNAADSHTYTLVSGTGSNNNGQFRIVGNELQTNAILNFESGQTRTIRIQTDDGNGGLFEKVLTIAVQNVNEAPTNVDVSENEFDENLMITDFTFIDVSDPDANDTHTFTLVSGDGDADNDKFEIGFNAIEGHFLTRLVDFDFESQNTFSIRLRATDAEGLFIESSIAILLSDIQEAPTDILLSSTSIDENSTPGTVVTDLSTEDDDTGDTHTYTLVSGDGDTDNSAFQISDNQMLNEGNLDFETKSSYNIRLQTNDGNGGLFEKAFVITINDVNEAPTNISLSNNTIDESNPIGTVVGLFSTTDEDAGQTHTYSLVSGPASAHNDLFSIVGNQLVSAVVFDYETLGLLSIRVRTDDGNGGTFESGFGLMVNDIPASITTVTLDNNTVNENETSGTPIGSLSTFGEDLSGSYTYTFVSGAGDTDNSSFSISGNQLFTTESFDFEAQSNYSVRIMTDDGNLSESFALTVTVEDVNEVPTDILLNGNSITENNIIGDVIGALTTTDEDNGQTHTYSLVSGTGDTDNASFEIVGNELRAAVVYDFESQSSYSIRIASDDGNGGVYEEAFTINVANENESIVVINPIEDQNLDEAFGTQDIDLTNVFEDQDGDALTFEVVSSNTDVVTASTSGSTLTITEIGGFGSSTIIVTADDGSGITTSDEFSLTVNDVNEAPVVANAIDDQSTAEGFGTTGISYGDVFSDPDGDDLTITVSSSNENVVTVALSANNQILINEVGVGESAITVTADDGRGGSVSDTFTFIVSEVLGLGNQLDIQVYPNPTTDFVNIESNNILTIQLIDLNGRLIEANKGTNIQMDLRSLSSGSYILQLTDGTSTIKRRIIKAN